ncbi:MAG: hypothetical protein JWM19_3734, partial [Actinomycetia bacterium]|nr:hypothetical protein [Actinomycetes bacterium]
MPRVTTPLDEWQSLDVPTRSAALAHARTLTPHPDPAVSAIAARYARDVLDRRQRTFFARLRRRTLVLSTVLIVGVIVTAIAASGSPSAGKAIPWVAVPVFLVV